MNIPEGTSPRSVEVVPGLRFRCQNCGICCRAPWYIEIQEDEVNAVNRLYPGGEWFKRMKVDDREIWTFRRAESGCPFLMEKNLCRIHVEHGESKKPHTCRQFPFHFRTLTRVGQEDAVSCSLSFACPTVADPDEEIGAVEERQWEGLLSGIIPKEKIDLTSLPLRSMTSPLDEKEYRHIQRWLTLMFRNPDRPLAEQLLAGYVLLSDYEVFSSQEKADPDYFTLLQKAFKNRQPNRMLQGYILGSIVILTELSSSPRLDLRTRFQNLIFLIGFMRGRGKVAWPFSESHPAIDLTALNRVEFDESDLMTEPLRRFVSQQIDHHFLGLWRNLFTGYQALLSIYGLTKWIARGEAVFAGRESVTRVEVLKAVHHVDYHLLSHRAYGDNPLRRGLLRVMASWFLSHDAYPASMVLF